MELVLQSLAAAAQTSPAQTWMAETKRILVTIALSLTFLGISAL